MQICSKMLLLTLKNVENTYELEVDNKINAKKVLNPPFITAGPIVVTVCFARSTILARNISSKFAVKQTVNY